MSKMEIWEGMKPRLERFATDSGSCNEWFLKDPTPQEIALARGFVANTGLYDVCHVVDCLDLRSITLDFNNDECWNPKMVFAAYVRGIL